MKRIVFLILFSSFFVLKAFSCFNYYYSLNKEGNLTALGEEWKFPFNKNFNLERNVSRLKKLETKLQKEKNYMLLSDYAVCLTKLGKNKEALQILVQLYKHYPNEYKIAANLGTAYELNALPDSALKYIKRDMELNPNDHEGSEWVHVKVLETKIAQSKNPSWLNDHSVLQLSDKQKKDTNVLKQISIQLQERVPYSPGPNEIMVSIFTDLGDLSANLKSIEYARAYYQIAQKYYGGKSPALADKIKAMEKLMNKYASVDVPKPPSMEQTNAKIGYFRYTELLTDNDLQHYVVNWSKINTKVDALLAYVDFTKTVEAAKDSALRGGSKQADGLKLIPETGNKIIKKDSSNNQTKAISGPKAWEAEQKDSSEKNHTLIYVLAAIFIACAGYLVVKKNKK
jgi:tetratricopeptide (TPR) repeat protein